VLRVRGDRGAPREEEAAARLGPPNEQVDRRGRQELSGVIYGVGGRGENRSSEVAPTEGHNERACAAVVGAGLRLTPSDGAAQRPWRARPVSRSTPYEKDGTRYGPGFARRKLPAFDARVEGRRGFEVDHPDVGSKLEKLVDPATRGDPESPLRWTCKSTHALANEMLAEHGIRVSDRTIAKLLKEHELSMAAWIDGVLFTEFDGREKGQKGYFPGGRVEFRREVVVAQGRSVRDRAPVAAKRTGKAEGPVDDFDGGLGDRIVVRTRPLEFVAEQMGMLGEEGQRGDVGGVGEHGELGELGRVQGVNERESCGASRATVGSGRATHRFLLAARLAVAEGIWNTSK